VRVLFVSDTHIGLDWPTRPRVVRHRRGDDFFQNFERALEPALAGEVDDLLVAHTGNWKQANSNAGWLEGHDATVLHGVHELGQVSKQRSRQYVRFPAALAAKLDDRRLSRRTRRKQRSKISIRRHENSTLDGSAIEDRIVLGVL